MEVKPFIRCVDYWPIKIPAPAMVAYKVMIDKGQIRKHHVMYNQNVGSTTVEYYSTIPHDWIKQELHKLTKEMTDNGK